MNFTPKQLSEKIGKTSAEINAIFCELDFIKKTEKGFEVTKKGKENGGIQKNYMGKDYVAWDEKILDNDIFKSQTTQENQIKDEQEKDFRTKFKAEIRTTDGHFVRSRAEAMIADWLYREFITYAYEKKLPIIEEVYCDFYIPKEKIYIEFWGLEDEKYQNRKIKKKEIYKKYDLKLIEIDNETINNIDDYLPRQLLKFGLKING